MSREIIDSAKANHLPRLRTALAAPGANVNERDSSQRTALHYAAQKGRISIMELLITSGADVNATACASMTPLLDACDEKEEKAALLLIQHGTNANIHGGIDGRTPFQLALRRGLVSVAKAMLDAGVADPNIKNATGTHDASYYVTSGSVPRARKEEVRGWLVQYSSLENAVKSGSATAIEAIVKQAFATNSIQTALDVYVKAVQAAPNVKLDAYRTQLLGSMMRINRPDLFHVLLYIRKEDAGVPASELLERLRFNDQTTALHGSAFFGVVGIVEYLLNKCDMDPDILDGLGRVPMQLVSDTNDPTGQIRALLKQAMQRRQFRTFTRQMVSCTELIASVSSTQEAVVDVDVQELEKLAKAISSVYDIRAVFNIGQAALGDDANAFKRVLSQSFTQLIQRKMVIGDREALYFKLILRECEQRRLLTEAEVEYWDLLAVKVNMESATWVKALKTSISNLEWRDNDLERHAVALKDQYQRLQAAVVDLKQRGAFATSVNSLRGLLSTVSVLLSVAGVSGVSDVLDTMVDLSSPLAVMATTFSIAEPDQLSTLDSQSQAPVSLTVKPGVAILVQRAGISPVELLALMQELLRLEKTTSARAPDTQGPASVEMKPALNQKEHVKESDLEQFPFHYAVKHSNGDLQAFLNITDFIDESDGDLNAVANIPIPKSTCSAKMNAVVYASFLGYVDIVKNLLKRPEYEPAAAKEKKFVTMQRAHDARKQSASSGIARSA